MTKNTMIQRTRTTNNSREKKMSKAEKREDLKHGLLFLLIPLTAFILAFLLNTFVLMTCIVPSVSMEDTLVKGTFLIASRIPYKYGRNEGKTCRGDIIIFRHEELGDKYIIKRVVGLPGETIEIREGRVYVNTRCIEETYISSFSSDSINPVTVPEECYFVLGDNRNESYDSRFWEDPFVSFDDIYGKVIFTLYPKIQKLN